MDEAIDILRISLIITQVQKDNFVFPAVELRRTLSKQLEIKKLIECAMRGRTIVVLPYFTDPVQSLNTLMKKGIIYRNNDEFYFNI